MRDEFWKMLIEYTHQESYIFHYNILNSRRYNFWTIVLFLTSASTIASLISDFDIGIEVPSVILALFAITAQVIQIMLPKFRFYKRTCAFKYFLHEFSTLVLEVKQEWRSIELKEHRDAQISKSIDKFEKRKLELSKLYLNDLELSFNACCDRKAEKDVKKEFSQYI